MAGIIQGIGGLLFGDSGKNTYEPDPYQVRSGAQVDTTAFNMGGESKFRSSQEFEKAKDRQAPTAKGPAGPVTVEGYRPGSYGGAKIDKGGFDSALAGSRLAATQADTARNQQVNDLGLLRSAALGEAPSVAEQQLQQGTEAAIKAQAAAAASVRGGAGARAAANRQAAFQGAEMQTKANQQAAALRAEEIANARGQLMAGGEALRTGDIQQQDVMLNAAQTALSPEVQQAQLEQQAKLQSMGLNTQAGMQTQQLTTQAGLQNQQLQNQVALANLQAGLQSTAQNDQYKLGLLGQISDVEKAQLGANMSREQLLANAGMATEQMRFDKWKAEQNLKSGIAAQNAQSDLMVGTAGLGFLGGLASSYIGTSGGSNSN